MYDTPFIDHHPRPPSVVHSPLSTASPHSSPPSLRLPHNTVHCRVSQQTLPGCRYSFPRRSESGNIRANDGNRHEDITTPAGFLSGHLQYNILPVSVLPASLTLPACSATGNSTQIWKLQLTLATQNNSVLLHITSYPHVPLRVDQNGKL